LKKRAAFEMSRFQPPQEQLIVDEAAAQRDHSFSFNSKDGDVRGMDSQRADGCRTVERSSLWLDCITAIGIGLIAGVILHVSQNARVLVKRVPPAWWVWAKQHEELTNFGLVALCALYSVPRLWFYFRNRKTADAAEAEVEVNSCTLSKEGVSSHDEAGSPSLSSTAVDCVLSRSTSCALTSRALPNANQSLAMDSNGFVEQSADASHQNAVAVSQPPVQRGNKGMSCFASLTAAISEQRSPGHSQQKQQLGSCATSFEAQPPRALHSVVNELLLGRCDEVLHSTCLHAVLQHSAADHWQHSLIDASIVDGLLLKCVLQHVGCHVRCLTFTQGSPCGSYDSPVNRLGDGDLCNALTHCPGLTELNCSFTGCCSDIELFKAARSGCCPALSILNLRYCSKVTDLGLIAAVGCFRSLQVVRCSGNQFLTDAFMFHLSQECRGLLELDCSNTQVSSSGLSLVLQNCLQLRRLYVAHCPLVTDSAFAVLDSNRSGNHAALAPDSTSHVLLIFGSIAALSIAVLEGFDSHLCTSVAAAVAGIVMLFAIAKGRKYAAGSKETHVWSPVRSQSTFNPPPGKNLTSVDLTGIAARAVAQLHAYFVTV
jgi:hypothetical protein